MASNRIGLGIGGCMQGSKIETTLGDLIFAVCEAASEATSSETERQQLSEIVLWHVLKENKRISCELLH